MFIYLFLRNACIFSGRFLWPCNMIYLLSLLAHFTYTCIPSFPSSFLLSLSFSSSSSSSSFFFFFYFFGGGLNIEPRFYRNLRGSDLWSKRTSANNDMKGKIQENEVFIGGKGFQRNLTIVQSRSCHFSRPEGSQSA